MLRWLSIPTFSAACVLLGACIKYNDPKDKESAGAVANKAESQEEGKADEKGSGKKKGKKRKNKQLDGLAYVDGTFDEQLDKSGVTIHKKDKVWPGYNFYTSRKQNRAQLVDMEGKVLHTWKTEEKGAWQHATLLPDGDVIVMVKDKRLFRVDKDSKVEWSLEDRVHHDLWVHTDGDVYALARRQRKNARYSPSVPTVDDVVLVISPDGKIKREISILGIIEKSPYAFMLADARALQARKIGRANPEKKKKKEFDILHANHVEVMDGRHAKKGEIFKAGNLLLSPRNLQAVFIVDPKTEKILWIWGSNNLIFPHHPTVTADGNILIFNNGFENTGSQIVEVNPSTNEVVWTYGPKAGFFSLARGSNQRLPNGNTLITESDTGYVFEVTPGGEKVWEFLNPQTRKKDKIRIAIWRMWRFAPEDLKFEFNGVAPTDNEEVVEDDEDDPS